MAKISRLLKKKTVANPPPSIMERLSSFNGLSLGTGPLMFEKSAAGPPPEVRRARIQRSLMQLTEGNTVEQFDKRSGWQKIPDEEMPKLLMDYKNILATENWVKLMEGVYDSPEIDIRDTRKATALGVTIGSGNRKDAKPTANLIEGIAGAAIKNGEDPYTWLAMGLQETSLDWDKWNRNMFHVLDLDKIEDWGKFADAKDYPDLFQSAFDFWEKKKREIPKHKVTEADRIQAWNGYGTITPKNNEYAGGKLYGIDLPINFDQNPVYGKTIIDLRDNVIKNNPEVVKIVEQARKKYKK